MSAPVDRRSPRASVEWAGPSRRSRLLAVATAIVLAALTATIVSLAWKRPPRPPAPPKPVEVTLVPSTPASSSPH